MTLPEEEEIEDRQTQEEDSGCHTHNRLRTAATVQLLDAGEWSIYLAAARVWGLGFRV